MYAQPPRHNSQVPGIIVGLLIAVLAYVMWTGSFPMPSNVSLPSGLNGATAPKPRTVPHPPVSDLSNSVPLPSAVPESVNPPQQGYIRSCADFKSTEVAPPECAGTKAIQPVEINVEQHPFVAAPTHANDCSQANKPLVCINAADDNTDQHPFVAAP